MARHTGNYNYTVNTLLREAGAHRSHGHCGANREDDHIIELRLVVAALNQLHDPTYTHYGWQSQLVEFFNANRRNHECLSHDKHAQKTNAVNKWIRGVEHLSPDEMKWINQIRDIWKQNRNKLSGFDQFKQALNSVLRLRSWLQNTERMPAIV